MDVRGTTAAFLAAPEWSQKIAHARAEFLHLAEQYILQNEEELGKTAALNRFLHQFNRGHVGEEIRRELRKPKIPIRTYYRWSKASKDRGLVGLLESYNNGGLRISKEIREKIEALIWKDHLTRYRDIYLDLSCLFRGKDKVPSYSTIRNYAKFYRENHWRELVLDHEGKKGLRDRNMIPALGRKDGDLTAPNQRWEIDTTIADLMTLRKTKDVHIRTSEGKRCKVIGVVDVFSRSVYWRLVERETGLMIGQVLKSRILTWGLPEKVVIDNGKPYKNRRVLGFLMSTGCEATICTPGEPVEKPFVERAFRLLTEEVFRRLPGYTGNCVANRPNEIEVEYTMDKLQEVIDLWVENVYDERVHSSTGQRPRERRVLPGFKPKTVSERELDILLMEEGTRKVRQGCISYQGGKYFHKILPDGQRVTIRLNDFDASELIVYLKGKFLCVAKDYAREGVTPEEIREVKKEQTRGDRAWIKTNATILRKHDLSKTGVLGLINYKEKYKPAELPRRADIVTFRGVLPDPPHEEPAPEEGLLYSGPDDKYRQLMREKRNGKVLNCDEEEFITSFRSDDHYLCVANYIDQELDSEEVAVHEG